MVCLLDYFAVRHLGKDPTAKKGVRSFTPGERYYFLQGWVLFERLRLTVESKMRGRGEDSDGGTSGPKPGTGTAAERRQWRSAEARDAASYH